MDFGYFSTSKWKITILGQNPSGTSIGTQVSGERWRGVTLKARSNSSALLGEVDVLGSPN
ncbi:hypothetical protein SLEP1_g4368 [Rubroshorea leprosula]|uniref:Uncharacterized protein n=1 Tax=Rubroshorea leprosula TaxID=152421 RepID=A0AAV5HNG9_9ROSI|nr:hypothetical protein SLEP1_g4368 [Rubroshorea leprosula]